MGFYAKYVLPRLIDLTMRNKEAARLRSVWIPRACGVVLEVGIGSGLNLPFYSAQVQHVYAVEPSPELQRMARRRAASGRLPVEILSQSAEDPLALSDASVDTIVFDLDLVFRPECPRSASADEQSSEAGWPINFYRTWLRA